MAISEKKMQIVIDNYFKSECDVNTSIRQAFEKGFRIGVTKGQCSQPKMGEWIPVSERLPKIADVYRVTRYYPNNVMNPKYIVDACAFDGSDTWYNDNRINHERAYADNVIAWQENPEPYKADMRGE